MVAWKGPHHPGRGGAEVYTRIVLEGLAARGLRVTWLVPASPDRPADETTAAGVRIVRRGGRLGHLWAVQRFLHRRQHDLDLVIDQINSYPMLTLTAVPPQRSLTLIHQLTREVWFHELPWPAATIGWLLEPLWLRAYRHRRAIAVSASTAADLRRFGFGDVRIVGNALPSPDPNGAERAPPAPPRFVGLGRLVSMKRFDHLLDAFDRVRNELPEARLTIIGRGRGRYARRLAARVRATPGATLIIDASERDKRLELGRATALVATSVREGWGLMVSEAHATGTPSIAYRVAGLRDSTRHGVNGVLTDPDPAALAAAMAALARDPRRWRALRDGALAGVRGQGRERLERAFAEEVEAALERAP